MKDAFRETSKIDKQNGLLYSLCWYGKRIGTFSIDDEEIHWQNYESDEFENLFPKRDTDNAPNFVTNIDAANPIFERLQEDTRNEYIKNGLRFLSNLTISPNCPFDRPTLTDTLLTDFSEHINDGTFRGYYAGKCPQKLDDSFENEIASLWTNRYTPRFSGKEIKIPATLNEGGILQASITSSFTHLIKFPIGEHKEGWGLNEWICLELSDHIGLETAQHALLPLDNNLPPALLVERFDIPQSPQENDKWLLIEDFCSLAGVSSENLTDGSMEKIAKLVKQHSTEPEKDLERLYKRTILSWAIKDNDMHRKNISMLLEYDSEKKEISRVSMAPTYDVTSEIHQEDKRQKMCLSIQGKTSSLNKKALVRFGETLGFSAEEAEKTLIETTSLIAEKTIDIANNIPKIAKEHDACIYAAQRIATLAVDSANTIGAPAPDWEPTKRITINEGAIGRKQKNRQFNF